VDSANSGHLRFNLLLKLYVLTQEFAITHGELTRSGTGKKHKKKSENFPLPCKKRENSETHLYQCLEWAKGGKKKGESKKRQSRVSGNWGVANSKWQRWRIVKGGETGL